MLPIILSVNDFVRRRALLGLLQIKEGIGLRLMRCQKWAAPKAVTSVAQASNGDDLPLWLLPPHQWPRRARTLSPSLPSTPPESQ